MEIQYTKNTSLRLKNTDPVFRLKQDNKNLYNREYTENLMKYLGFARKAGNIIINDLSDAIKKITDKNLDIQEKSSVVFDNHLPKPGEHVAVLWIEGANEVVWYLCFFILAITRYTSGRTSRSDDRKCRYLNGSSVSLVLISC